MNVRSALPFLILALVAFGLAASSASSHDEHPAPVPQKPRNVDLVICLDTSGSMSGLINAARQKIWSLVGEMGTLKPEPNLRVALLTYGSPGNNARGHVVVQTDLTTDLDLVSEKLFALGTQGGTELVGRVLHYAMAELNWSRGHALRSIFVAGNESADQDREKPFRTMAKQASQRGIFVNAIYCGGADDGDGASWRQLAAAGLGKFSSIDHNHGSVNVVTPFDKELARLSGSINSTYVFYGAKRGVAKARQVAQDKNATSAGAPAAAQRAEAKAGMLYKSALDLVDRMQEPGFDIAKIAVGDLPAPMREMDVAARKAHLSTKWKERQEIRARIKELSAKRAAHVKKVMEEQQLDDTRSLDRALRDAVKEQAAKTGFEVAK